ncbi:DUF6879 family protein [Streptomyces nigra]|uniref:DUF6879 family protein n=1 Tax=Streptomyces nigra TaxID=1827580 RepID=UPI00369EF4F5
MFRGIQSEAWRLETLPQYLVPQEAAEIEAFRAGKRIDPHTYSSPYADDLKRLYGEGKRKGRVHILTRPRSAYLCFKFSRYYEPHAAAGENILTKLSNVSRLTEQGVGGPWCHPWPYRPKPTQPTGPHSTPARSQNRKGAGARKGAGILSDSPPVSERPDALREGTREALRNARELL